MSEEFTIAPAVTSDASGLVALRAAVAAEGEFLVAEAGESAWPLDAMIARVRAATGAPSSEAPARCLYVARGRHRVVGFIEVQPGAFRRNRHVGYVEVMVAADWRGRGVGRALMDRALEWASRSPLQKLALSVYAHNAPAIALYRKLGFEEEGRRVAEYLFPDGSYRDDVLMARFVARKEP